MTRWRWIVAAPVLIAGCAAANEPKTGKTEDVPIFNMASIGTHLTTGGILDYNTTVSATNPTTLLEALDFHKQKKTRMVALRSQLRVLMFNSSTPLKNNRSILRRHTQTLELIANANHISASNT